MEKCRLCGVKWDGYRNIAAHGFGKDGKNEAVIEACISMACRACSIRIFKAVFYAVDKVCGEITNCDGKKIKKKEDARYEKNGT